MGDNAPFESAFPGKFARWIDSDGQPTYDHARGMSLRDYFAAQALTALLARARTHYGLEPALVADDAYRYADSMLIAREKGQA